MEARDSSTPPGWRRDPSRSSKRWVLAALALAGFVIAARLGAYQLGLTPPPWEPWFGSGTRTVLHSPVSGLLPLPDAVLGAIAYLLEIPLTLAGGPARWRTHPRLALAYGALALGMALTSFVLVLMQATIEHAFCTLCLASAAISFVIVGPALTEAIAALEHVLRRAGSSPIHTP